MRHRLHSKVGITMKRQIVLTTITMAASAFFYAGDLHAYSYLKNWNYKPVKVEDGDKLNYHVTRDILYTGPNLGGYYDIAQSAHDICSMVEAWNDVRGSNNKLECTITAGSYHQQEEDKRDGKSVVFFADAEFMQDGIGVTIVKGKRLGLSHYIYDADIGIRDDVRWNYGSDFGAGRSMLLQTNRHRPFDEFGNLEPDYESSFREIILHELGHALGLGHTITTTSVMMGNGALGLLYGFYKGEEHTHPYADLRFRPMPDESDGIRSIYPNEHDVVNLMTSFFVPDTATGFNAKPKADLPLSEHNYNYVQNVCPGSNIPMVWTIINNGTIPLAHEYAYLTSLNENITMQDYVMKTEYRVDFEGSVTTLEDNRIRVPDDIRTGEYYYVGVFANFEFHENEQFQSDNRTTNLVKYYAHPNNCE